MRKRKQDHCAYCGVFTEITREHVIPRSVFRKPLPSNMDKVMAPACEPCNNSKSKDDTYFKDLLAADVQNKANPLTSEMYQSMRRATGRNQSELARQILSDGRLERRYDQAGTYIGDCYKIPLDEQRMIKIFSTFVRGLHYNKWKTLFPVEYTFLVRRLEPCVYLETFNMVIQSSEYEFLRMGEGDFTWTHSPLIADSATAVNLLSFHDTIFGSVLTKSPN